MILKSPGIWNWVVPKKIHTPPTEEISAIRGGGREFVLRMSWISIGCLERGRGVLSISSVGGGWIFSGMTHCDVKMKGLYEGLYALIFTHWLWNREYSIISLWKAYRLYTDKKYTVKAKLYMTCGSSYWNLFTPSPTTKSCSTLCYMYIYIIILKLWLTILKSCNLL